MADEAAGGGKRERGEGSSGDEDVASAPAEVEGGEAIDLALPVGFLGKRQIGGVGECLGDGGIPLAGELGEELVAYAVAGEIEGRVGGVFAPWKVAPAEEVIDIGALDVEQRADNTVRR